MKVRRLSRDLIGALAFLFALASGATMLPGSLATPVGAGAAPVPGAYHAHLRGFKEVPQNVSAATGMATVVLSGDESTITVNMSFSGLGSNASAAHIHQAAAGVNGPIIIPLTGVPGSTSGSIPAQTLAITAPQVAELKAGGLYVNLHSTGLPGGEIRGQLVVETYTTSPSGAQEVPPNASAGTGTAEVGLSANESTVIIDLGFQGLGSNATAAHIHQAPPGVNGPIIIPISGVPAATSGRVPEQPAAITTAQVTDLRAGNLYVNVHSTVFPGGEIRGQLALAPTAVRIGSASATRAAHGVLLRWRTASEVGIAGFNLYRERGGLVRMNRRLIRSLSTGATRGHSYSWLDRGAPAGKARYRIESVSVRGARSWVAWAVAGR